MKPTIEPLATRHFCACSVRILSLCIFIFWRRARRDLKNVAYTNEKRVSYYLYIYFGLNPKDSIHVYINSLHITNNTTKTTMATFKPYPVPSTVKIQPELAPFVPPIKPKLVKFVHPGGVIDPTNIPALQRLSITDPGVLHIKSITPLNYKPLAIAHVNLLPYGAGDGHVQFTTDAQMAYQSAVAYLVTANVDYAKQVVAILDAWASTCTLFEGPNAPLDAAWGTAAMARAAELLKYTWSNGWKASGVESRYLAWVDAHILSLLTTPLTWDNRNNWGLSMCEARLMLSILREGTVTHAYDWSKEFLFCQFEYQRIHSGYVAPTTGEIGEVHRDCGHAQFSLGSLVQIAEMLWHQGIDVYSFRDSLLHTCMEFHAQIMLGQIPKGITPGPIIDLTYLPCGWRISRKHYVGRKGRTMLHVDTLLSKYPNDCFTFHWGLGSLTHR